MINCEVTDYQPGTATRYLLIHGTVPPEDAAKIGCAPGVLFVSWEGHGAWPFNADVHPEYVAEKFKIPHYMLDAWAIAQFVRAKLGADLLDGSRIEKENYWKICGLCGLPVYTSSNQECFCKGK